MKNFNINGKIISNISNQTFCNIYKNIGIKFENDKFKCESDFMSEYVFDDIFDAQTKGLIDQEITIIFNILDKVDRNIKINESINFKITKDGNVIKTYTPGKIFELRKDIIEELNLNFDLFLEIKKNEMLKKIIDLEISCEKINIENCKETLEKACKVITELNGNEIIS